MKISFAWSSRSFVSWSLVFTVTNSICWRCRMTLSSPRTTFSVGLGHNKRVFPPQCAVQVAKDVLEDLTARLSHRFATHAQDHGLWNVLRSSENWTRTSIHNRDPLSLFYNCVSVVISDCKNWLITIEYNKNIRLWLFNFYNYNNTATQF